MKTEVDINANMITWAISRAGYELQEFADRSPNVLEWINRTKKPTVKQLEDFSRRVHIPFGYFFLQEPPRETLPFPFFRTNGTQAASVSLNVYDTIAVAQQRQNWLKEYLKDNEYQTLPFVGKFSGSNSYQEITYDIRLTLGLKDDWASAFQKFEDALDFLVQKIEDIGIFIFFNGVVENNTSRPIEVNECRGFVLVDQIAPFMFINAADAKAAQLFTIVHELAHIWTGHSAGFDFSQLLPADDPVERLCDKVSAEFLVPESSFNRLWKEHPEIKYLGRYFKVSQIVIARRALDLKKISKKEFFQFYNAYISQFQQKKENQSSGGDFYATTRRRLGHGFAGYINQAVKSNKLLYRDAYKLTSLKGDTFQNFFNKHFLK